MFTIWSTCLSTWAVRHVDDLHNVKNNAFQTVLNGVNHSEAQEVSVRTQHAVFGHTALKTVQVYSLQADKGVCQDVTKKLSTFAEEQLAFASTEGRAADTNVDEAFLEGRTSTGYEQLFKAFAVLDQTDLRDAMEVGEVWTLDDQDKLVECETGRALRAEEETQTESGSQLVQGDIISEGISSFLEMVSDGTRWSLKKLWPPDPSKTSLPFKTSNIRYCFHPDLHASAIEAVHAAINHTMAQVPCLQFTDVGYNDKNPGSCNYIPSVSIQDTDKWKCWSYVGLQDGFLSKGKSQPLNLGEPCWTMAIAAHELGHVLGMFHEQARMDRDKYITVHWDNIPTGARKNFNLQLGSALNTVYDPLSLMHYSADAFATDPSQPTITAHNPRVTRLFGARQGWSEMDVQEIDELYCGKKSAMVSTPFVHQMPLLARLVGGEYNRLMYVNCLSSALTAKLDSRDLRRMQAEERDRDCMEGIYPRDGWGSQCARAYCYFTHYYERLKDGFLRSDKTCSIANHCLTSIYVACPSGGFKMQKGQEIRGGENGDEWINRHWQEIGSCGYYKDI